MRADYLRELVRSWSTFDWRRREAELNRHPQFLAEIEDATIHFVHQRAARDDDGVSVAEQDGDPGSLLNHYRRLLALRAAHPALRSESLRVLDAPGDLLVVERTSGDEEMLIIANLSGKPASYPATGRDLLANKTIGGRLELKPYQATVIAR